MKYENLTRHRLIFPAAIAVVALLFFVPGAALAQGSIEGSQHDLGAGGAGQLTLSGKGVCVFCHTPHGADTTAPAPLWNKTIDTSTNYQRYSDLGTVSLDGAETTVGSVSLACLSCHDGTQAMDAVVNAPGSGMQTGNLGTGTNMSGTPVPNLTTDLQDDHPISIQYAGGGCDTSQVACATLGDSDFVVPDNTTINGTTVWWVDLGSSVDVAGSSVSVSAGSRDKHDMLLYTREAAAGGNATGSEPFVECGSCHDPHNANTQPVNFLRIDNEGSTAAGSAVCLACHNK